MANDERLNGTGGHWSLDAPEMPGATPHEIPLQTAPAQSIQDLLQDTPLPEGFPENDGPQFLMPKRRRNVRKIIYGVIAGVVVAAIVWVLLRQVLAGPDPVYAEVGATRVGDIRQTLNTSGTLTTGRRVTVYAPVAAPVAAVHAEPGRTVMAGQLLFEFDTLSLQQTYRQAAANNGLTALQAQQALTASNESQQAVDDYQASINNVEVQLASAQAALEQATADYAVNLPLITQLTTDLESCRQQLEWEYYYNSGVPGSAEKVAELKLKIAELETHLAALQAPLDAARQDVAYQTELLARVKTAQGTAETGVLDDNARQQLQYQQVPSQVAYENAKRNLELASVGLTAPINGVVTTLAPEVGAMVNAYAALCVIESLDEVGVVVNLSRYDLERVQEGESATVESMGKTYNATVTKINRMATQSGGTGLVSATITLTDPGSDILLGLEASVSILTGQLDNVLLVPLAAINTDVRGNYCFVIEDGVARRRAVEIGMSSSSEAEVLSGLSEDEEVALYSQNLSDGDRITDDKTYAPAANLIDLIP